MGKNIAVPFRYDPAAPACREGRCGLYGGGKTRATFAIVTWWEFPNPPKSVETVFLRTSFVCSAHKGGAVRSAAANRTSVHAVAIEDTGIFDGTFIGDESAALFEQRVRDWANVAFDAMVAESGRILAEQERTAAAAREYRESIAPEMRRLHLDPTNDGTNMVFVSTSADDFGRTWVTLAVGHPSASPRRLTPQEAYNLSNILREKAAAAADWTENFGK